MIMLSDNMKQRNGMKKIFEGILRSGTIPCFEPFGFCRKFFADLRCRCKRMAGQYKLGKGCQNR